MSTWRPLVCAGAVVGGLVVAAPGAGVAVADPGPGGTDRGRHSSESGKRDDDRSDRESARRGSARDGDRSPAADVRRSLRDVTRAIRGPRAERRDDRDRDEDRADDERDDDGFRGRDGAPKRDPGRLPLSLPGFENSVSVPVVAPTPESERAGKACVVGACLTTARVSVAVGETFSLSVATSEPEPEPGPTFRGAEEEPSVVEADGGDSGRLSAGAPEVLEAPVVVAAPAGAGMAGLAGGPAAVAPGVPVAGAPAPPQAGFFGIPSGVPFSGPVLGPTGAPVPGGQGSGGAPPAGAGAPATRFGVPSATRPGTPAAELLGALPGLLGLFLVTIAGGFIGYRQANAGRYVRSDGADRFLE